MKKVILALVIACLIFPLRLFSLELELTGGIGNTAFEGEQKSALSDETVEGAFSPMVFPLALIRLSGEYGGLSWNTGFEKDPMIRNRLFGNLKFEADRFFIEAGPFVGIFNAPGHPLNLGISASLGFTIPRILFVKAGGSSTLGAVMDITDNYVQNSGDLSVGFWVPHVICSLNMEYRNFAQRENSNLLIEDALVRYFLRADVFAKNVPFTVKVDMGYQKLSRSYTSGIVNGTDVENKTQADEFKSVFIGMEANYTFSSALKFLMGGEMPVYSWCVRPMQNPPKGTMLFKAWAGVVWSLPSSR